MSPDKVKDKQRARAWAQKVLQHPDMYVLLDVETTGLKGQIVEITITSADHPPIILLDRLIKPTVPVEAGAYAVHKIGEEALSRASELPLLWPSILKTIGDKTIISYNAKFDMERIQTSAKAHTLTMFKNTWECAMLQYSAYVGLYDVKRANYKYQKLPGAGHRAIGDCIALSDLLWEMAQR